MPGTIPTTQYEELKNESLGSMEGLLLDDVFRNDLFKVVAEETEKDGQKVTALRVVFNDSKQAEDWPWPTRGETVYLLPSFVKVDELKEKLRKCAGEDVRNEIEKVAYAEFEVNQQKLKMRWHDGKPTLMTQEGDRYGLADGYTTQDLYEVLSGVLSQADQSKAGQLLKQLLEDKGKLKLEGETIEFRDGLFAVSMEPAEKGDIVGIYVSFTKPGLADRWPAFRSLWAEEGKLLYQLQRKDWNTLADALRAEAEKEEDNSFMAVRSKIEEVAFVNTEVNEKVVQLNWQSGQLCIAYEGRVYRHCNSYPLRQLYSELQDIEGTQFEDSQSGERKLEALLKDKSKVQILSVDKADELDPAREKSFKRDGGQEEFRFFWAEGEGGDRYVSYITAEGKQYFCYLSQDVERAQFDSLMKKARAWARGAKVSSDQLMQEIKKLEETKSPGAGYNFSENVLVHPALGICLTAYREHERGAVKEVELALRDQISYRFCMKPNDGTAQDVIAKLFKRCNGREKPPVAEVVEKLREVAKNEPIRETTFLDAIRKDMEENAGAIDAWSDNGIDGLGHPSWELNLVDTSAETGLWQRLIINRRIGMYYATLKGEGGKSLTFRIGTADDQTSDIQERVRRLYGALLDDDGETFAASKVVTELLKDKSVRLVRAENLEINDLVLLDYDLSGVRFAHCQFNNCNWAVTGASIEMVDCDVRDSHIAFNGRGFNVKGGDWKGVTLAGEWQVSTLSFAPRSKIKDRKLVIDATELRVAPRLRPLGMSEAEWGAKMQVQQEKLLFSAFKGMLINADAIDGNEKALKNLLVEIDDKRYQKWLKQNPFSAEGLADALTKAQERLTDTKVDVEVLTEDQVPQQVKECSLVQPDNRLVLYADGDDRKKIASYYFKQGSDRGGVLVKEQGESRVEYCSSPLQALQTLAAFTSEKKHGEAKGRSAIDDDPTLREQEEKRKQAAQGGQKANSGGNGKEGPGNGHGK